MSYIGNEPTVGQWRKLTDISGSFNGVTTSFTTSVPPGTSDYYVTAGSASQLIISLGGVIQEPGVDYTVSTNTITFTTAPTSGLSFFGVLCGDALNIGVPSDGTVTASKLTNNLSIDLTSGSAATPSLTFDANTGFYSPGEDQVAISTGGTGRLVIDSSGRVGIGTTSPDAPLQVNSAAVPGAVNDGIKIHIPASSGGGGTGNSLLFTALNGSSAQVSYSSIASLIATNTAGSHSGTLTFSTASGGANTERARIDSSGRLLVGTSSATLSNTKLQVGSSGSTSNNALLINNGTESLVLYYAQSGLTTKAVATTTNDRIYVYSNFDAGNGVYMAAGATSWTGTSDERLKTNLIEIGDGLGKIACLRAVTGRFKADPEETSRSFLIAQDVLQVLPEAVDTTNPDELGLRYAEVIPLLVAALKESKERIETLEAKVAALEGV